MSGSWLPLVRWLGAWLSVDWLIPSVPPLRGLAFIAALTDLRGDGPPLLPRTYLNWTGPSPTATCLAHAAEIAGTAAGWDPVLCFRDRSGDIPAWTRFVEEVVAAHGRELAAGATAAVGFAVVPEVDAAHGEFWPEVARLGGEDFAAAVD